MDKERRNDIKSTYKQTHQPVGVYRILNTVNGKMFVGSSVNIPARLNRHKAELTMGSHRNRKLQDACNEYGIDNFTFDILECLETDDDLQHDYTDDLKALTDLWLEKLSPYGDNGYN